MDWLSGAARMAAPMLVRMTVLGWCLGAGAQFYVATNGNDQWSGRLPEPSWDGTDGPFATLERARDELRVLNQGTPLPNGATVFVRGGTYYRTNTFELGMPDSGSSQGPIVYQAYPNETPILTSAFLIEGFGPWRGPILQANLAARGLANLSFRQLFFNGHRQQLARYPNYVESAPYLSNWSFVDGPLSDMYVDLTNDSKNSFHYKAGDVRFWARPQEVEVSIFPRYNWFNDIIPVSSVDTAQRLITLESNAAFALRPGDRYFVRNVFEELDYPGEWYMDNQFGVLYFWPPCAAGDAAIHVPALANHLVVISGANITFQGFTLECCDGSAIGLHGTTNCNVLGCTIRNVLNYGIAAFGYGNTILGNDIYAIGNEAIHLDGGVQATLSPGTNLIENNYIHDVGVFQRGASAISVDGVGNVTRYNLIHNCPRGGLVMRGNLNVAEYNRIYHVNLETDDTGAIFTSSVDWITSRGNIIRYNYVSDNPGLGFNSGQYGVGNYAWGVYLDADAAGVDVLGNLLTGSSRSGIFLNNGRDNLICNNILVNNTAEQLTYGGWTSTSADWQQYLPGMIAGYDSVAYLPEWQALRGMNVGPTAAVLPDGLIMASNRFFSNIIAFTNRTANVYGMVFVPFYANEWSSNVVYGYGTALNLRTNGHGASFANWQAQGYDRGSITADPLFVNVSKGDFRLQSNSPAFALGFQELPLDQIGLYPSSFRASWPVAAGVESGALELELQGGDVIVRLQSSVDHGYQMQRADSLTDPVWQDIGAPQEGRGDVLTFVDVFGAMAPERYYRFRICP